MKRANESALSRMREHLRKAAWFERDRDFVRASIEGVFAAAELQVVVEPDSVPSRSQNVDR